MAVTAEYKDEKDEGYKTLRSIRAANWFEERGKPLRELVPDRKREITDKYRTIPQQSPPSKREGGKKPPTKK